MEAEQIISYTFTVAETNQIISALVERPMKEVVDLVNKIHTQANEQLKPSETTTE
jgi:hypothetical protein